MSFAATYWEQMPYFLAVAREGSLRAAAIKLGTTHAKLNRHIQALEAAYGTELIWRGRRGVTLTDAGQKLLPVAEEAELLFLQAQRNLFGLDKQESGDIHFSISGPLAYSFWPQLSRNFRKAFPQSTSFHMFQRPLKIRNSSKPMLASGLSMR